MWRDLILISCLSVLVAGCVAPEECDWTEDISYSTYESLGLVVRYDEELARQILAHNENRSKFCVRRATLAPRLP